MKLLIFALALTTFVAGQTFATSNVHTAVENMRNKTNLYITSNLQELEEIYLNLKSLDATLNSHSKKIPKFHLFKHISKQYEDIVLKLRYPTVYNLDKSFWKMNSNISRNFVKKIMHLRSKHKYLKNSVLETEQEFLKSIENGEKLVKRAAEVFDELNSAFLLQKNIDATDKLEKIFQELKNLLNDVKKADKEESFYSIYSDIYFSLFDFAERNLEPLKTIKKSNNYLISIASRQSAIFKKLHRKVNNFWDAVSAYRPLYNYF